MADEKCLGELFASVDTSREDIDAAGWYVEHSMGGSWWFRMHPKTGSNERQSVPFWIRQMVHDAYEEGQERARSEMRHAMGITGKQKKRDACQMFRSVP